jgi:hypothetical protein
MMEDHVGSPQCACKLISVVSCPVGTVKLFEKEESEEYLVVYNRANFQVIKMANEKYTTNMKSAAELMFSNWATKLLKLYTEDTND